MRLYLLNAIVSLAFERPVLAAIVLVPLGLGVAVIIYRLWFHPLSSIPGPRLACVSKCYETWFDVVREGNFPFEIKRLHDIYGPIVRIGPNEVHVNDAAFVSEILPGANRKRDKDEWSTRIFPLGTLGKITDHDLHLQQRKTLVKYFSRREVLRFEGLVDGYLAKLIEKLDKARRAGAPVNLSRAFEALARDFIVQYVVADEPGDLDRPEFNPEIHEKLMDVHYTQWTFRSFPVLNRMPLWSTGPLRPYVRAHEQLGKMIVSPLGQLEDHLKRDISAADHPSILSHLQSPDFKGDKNLLWSNASNASLAGMETTPSVLAFLTFHILNQPHIHQKLRSELRAAQHESHKPIPLTELEKLPYLRATIKEGLRLSFGISSRLARIAPHEDLVYITNTRAFVIPRGSIISTSPILHHLNPTTFPNPHTFDPSRWLQPNPPPDAHLLAFSKGSRQCLGMHAAYLLLYKSIGAIFGRYSGAGDGTAVLAAGVDADAAGGDGGKDKDVKKLKLYQTDRSDVEMVHDFFLPFPRLDSQGVRVVVEGSGR